MAVQRGARATERLNLRATRKQTRLVKLAATETGATVSAFVIESSCRHAEEVLAAKQHFELPGERWKKFTAALDREPKHKPTLRKLLTEPSVLDRGR